MLNYQRVDRFSFSSDVPWCLIFISCSWYIKYVLSDFQDIFFRFYDSLAFSVSTDVPSLAKGIWSFTIDLMLETYPIYDILPLCPILIRKIFDILANDVPIFSHVFPCFPMLSHVFPCFPHVFPMFSPMISIFSHEFSHRSSPRLRICAPCAPPCGRRHQALLSNSVVLKQVGVFSWGEQPLSWHG